MTFKPNDPRSLEIARKGASVDNAGRFRSGEPRASIEGRKGRLKSPWYDGTQAGRARHARLQMIRRLAHYKTHCKK